MDRHTPMVSRIQGVLAVGQGSSYKRMQEQSGEGMLVEGTSEGGGMLLPVLSLA